ncbi:photosynthetic complex putative assembly protein PuhB [Chromatocurvus halotolerans]|uniref:PH (Pleckstrin Homology) domain-containing protein n=1 Tax=Chromatocurvus halotolerans TaxID=1132028 RepID=A0A4R2KTS7_9GAMM|nr:photosynthetic complex putative assembly protein PuhB [Chromatocurvus halotolerans]TCO77193.1 PH (Pleckstrin Homology) domain-containing protein [Chromatocurvus halotolerans]
MNEYEIEPVKGLPEELPAGEHMTWQGSPDWRSMARRTFRVQQFGLYFAVLIGAHQVIHYSGGGDVAGGIASLAWQAGLGLFTLALLSGLAWLFARSTVYTITNKRVVLRFGVAIPMMINLPFDRMHAADLRAFNDGSGDIALRLEDGERISYWALWPHARPWSMSPVIPMLRNVPDATRVAGELAAAVAAHRDDVRTNAAVSVSKPTRQPDSRELEQAGALA